MVTTMTLLELVHGGQTNSGGAWVPTSPPNSPPRQPPAGSWRRGAPSPKLPAHLSDPKGSTSLASPTPAQFPVCSALGGSPLILTPCLGFPDGLSWRRWSLPAALPPPVLLVGANSRCSRSRRGGPQVPYDEPTAVLSLASSRCTRPGPCSSSWGARVTRQVCRLYGVTEMQDFHHHC